MARAIYALASVAPARLTFGEHVIAEVRTLLEIISPDASGADDISVAERVSQRMRVDAATARSAVEKCILAQTPDHPHRMPSRSLLQWWGTDVRRREDPLYWLRRMSSRVDELAADEAAFVTDCRYPEELMLLRAAGFRTVRIQVPEQLRRLRILERDGFLDPATDRHATETSIGPDIAHDVTVDNTGDLSASARYVLARVRPALLS
ncbi:MULTISPECIES: hypothetical protein [unclassified Streptomyces]|uniref:deoxynucleotide monophosphate kinase family protein n=1 Tax=unclassified Streptomyces TaxID=2593676 RepID=UPI002366EA43|nr:MULTISPECIES: hypothetical protein [unclassified Streptomyces]MDF3141158.1 hypothetical protein [Streptomyces sp. T21Q-yed]WDF41415.1 hypothetical protein PBV52_33810 [Streptomyces sp. T12]